MRLDGPHAVHRLARWGSRWPSAQRRHLLFTAGGMQNELRLLVGVLEPPSPLPKAGIQTEKDSTPRRQPAESRGELARRRRIEFVVDVGYLPVDVQQLFNVDHPSERLLVNLKRLERIDDGVIVNGAELMPQVECQEPLNALQQLRPTDPATIPVVAEALKVRRH